MKMFVTPGWGSAALGIAILAAAAPASAAPLTLESCVRLSLKNNLAVERAEGAVRNAGSDVTGARAAFLPSITASGRWTKPENAIEVFREDLLDFVFYDELWSYSANANLMLFDGFGNIANYRSAKRGREAAEGSYLDARQGVVFETERRFFEVLKTEALLEVQEEATKLSGEQLKKTEAMKELGASTLADVYKSEVDHANNRLESLRARRNLDVARASLATYLGLDPREDVELTPASLDDEIAGTLDAQLTRALEVNPQLHSSRQTERARASGVTSAKSERWPSLSAFASIGYSFFEPNDFTDENIDQTYGLAVNLTVFDGFLTKSRIRRAESDLLTARRTVESTERDVLFAVRQAWLDLEIAREAIRVTEDAVKSSEEDLRLAQERFKIGEGTILDVIDAQVNLTRSRSNLVTATYDRRLAVSAVRDAVGDIPVPDTE